MLMLSSAALAAKVTTGPCEAPEVIAAMKKALANGKFEDGRSILSYGISVDRLSNVRTLQSSKTKMVCAVSVNLTYRGEVQRVDIRLTVQDFANGKTTAWITGR
jgi:hypothetical protein